MIQFPGCQDGSLGTKDLIYEFVTIPRRVKIVHTNRRIHDFLKRTEANYLEKHYISERQPPTPVSKTLPIEQKGQLNSFGKSTTYFHGRMVSLEFVPAPNLLQICHELVLNLEERPPLIPSIPGGRKPSKPLHDYAEDVPPPATTAAASADGDNNQDDRYQIGWLHASQATLGSTQHEISDFYRFQAETHQRLLDPVKG